MLKAGLRIFLVLISSVTIVDIIVVHWLLRRHRLSHGPHVLLAESSLLVLACTVLIVVRRRPRRVYSL